MIPEMRLRVDQFHPFRTGTLPVHTATHRAAAHSTSDPTHATTNTVMAMLKLARERSTCRPAAFPASNIF